MSLRLLSYSSLRFRSIYTRYVAYTHIHLLSFSAVPRFVFVILPILYTYFSVLLSSFRLTYCSYLESVLFICIYIYVQTRDACIHTYIHTHMYICIYIICMCVCIEYIRDNDMLSVLTRVTCVNSDLRREIEIIVRLVLISTR